METESAKTPGHAEALADLRATLKWMVASSGAIAAAVVAGLQLRDIQDGPFPRVLWAGASAALALLCVLGLLAYTVNVLTLPRPTANEISNREVRAGVAPTPPIPLETPKDQLVSWVQSNRTALLGGAATVTELYTNSVVGAGRSLKELQTGRPTEWLQRQYASTSENIAFFERVTAEARENLELIESGAHLFITRQKYRGLLKFYIAGIFVFTAAVVSFVVATLTVPVVDQPMAVRVVIINRADAGLPESCTDDELTAVAVSGTVSNPTVVTEPADGCPATTIENGRGILAIPVVS